MNLLRMVTTSISKIPPNLPLPKGGIPLFGRRPIGPLARKAKRGLPVGRGRFSNACQFNFETLNIMSTVLRLSLMVRSS
jgi:hypothetical protein